MPETIVLTLETMELDWLNDQLTRATIRCREVGEYLTAGVANILLQYLREEVPVRTGALLRSLRVVKKISGDIVELGIKMLYYGIYRQFGTRYAIPDPFITRAFERAQPFIQDLLNIARRKIWPAEALER